MPRPFFRFSIEELERLVEEENNNLKFFGRCTRNWRSEEPSVQAGYGSV
ncbi:MAG: hypothetical protein NNA22_01200 [Nitrospira sp.]|nr:hypothetical protein [Nitrospira sp.]